MTTVTVRLVNVPCTCDEYVMCAQCEAANDAVVASQDMYTTMLNEAGLARMTRHYREYRARDDVGVLDRALERYAIFAGMVSERPITAPVDPMSRRWNRVRVSRLAPADAILSTTPVPAISDTVKNW